jgi:TorA maturation chaperone TorD
LDQSGFSLLSRLWLKEADAAILAELDALPGLVKPEASLQELAIAFADSFLINGYPYASVFLDLNGEMNGQRSQELLALYRRFGYQPEALTQVGAPDHIGLVLGLLAHIPQPLHANVLSQYVLDWAPVLCLSIERQPEVHPFYRALAVYTRQELFRAMERVDLNAEPLSVSEPSAEAFRIELPLYDPGEELSLSEFIHYLLCPARSGVFFSRAHLGQWARKIGIPLAFGERYRLGISLFEAAGMADRMPEFLEWLLKEFDAWDAAYVTWVEEISVWALYAGEWRERIASARTLIEKARDAVLAKPL